MSKESSSQIRIYNQIIGHLMDDANETIESNLKTNRFLNAADWLEILKK
jgi:hypothetical protein